MHVISSDEQVAAVMLGCVGRPPSFNGVTFISSGALERGDVVPQSFELPRQFTLQTAIIKLRYIYSLPGYKTNATGTPGI